jgi:hypothetical protein
VDHIHRMIAGNNLPDIFTRSGKRNHCEIER